MEAGNETDLVQALKSIHITELKAQVQEATLINELRSGERGKAAQRHLLELQAK